MSCHCLPGRCRCVFPDQRLRRRFWRRSGGAAFGAAIALALYGGGIGGFVLLQDAQALSRPQMDPPAEPSLSARPKVGLRAAQPQLLKDRGSISDEIQRLKPAPPKRIVIPQIGVDAFVGKLGLTPDGRLEVPSNFQATGWYEGSALAGQRGPMVIAGHFDSYTGPAVFEALPHLGVGSDIHVVDEKGWVWNFRVTEARWYPKSEFPTTTVYGPTANPTIRLITCGGLFDAAAGHYAENLVVYGVLTR